MNIKRWCAVLIVATLLPCAAAAGADKAAASQTATEKSEKKPKDDDKASKDGQPACMQCGATCGLRPVCVCKPGTKTVPEPEFSTTCEPVCIPGCGSKPWPWCRPGRWPGCTSCTDSCTDCGDEPCNCPGRVRQRKVLVWKTVDAEKPVVKHSVGYLCCRCEAAQRPQGHGCCTPHRGAWQGCLDWIASLWRH
jgi:hypothetical protein